MKSPLRTLSCCLLAAAISGVACVAPLTTRLTLPTDFQVMRGQLVIRSDFPLPAQHRLFEELTARRRDLQERLRVPASDEPIQVYLFDNANRFEAFVRLHHPRFPDRRAFFLETDSRLVVYAQWGDRMAEDLRHEITHGYLHAVVPNLPLWLDEGLAEYFEVPRGFRGLNRTHLEQLADRLRQGHWHPDLARLEALDPAIDMTQEDYAEAWAWVHFLLETPIEQYSLLPDYLADLRRDGSARAVTLRLSQCFARPEDALVEHIGRLAADNRL